MKKSLRNYQSSRYAKTMAASFPKVGKTSFLAASLLGVLPWQRGGGVVSRPQNLHLFAFDQSALQGLHKFLVDSCKMKSEDADAVSTYNFSNEILAAFGEKGEYNLGFYQKLKNQIMELQEMAGASKGVHAALYSSLTGLAVAIERSIIGSPEEGGGEGGAGYSDQNKWTKFAQLMAELRAVAQIDNMHCIWEAHIDRTPVGRDGDSKDSIMVRGRTGRDWAFNVSEVFRIFRDKGNRYVNKASGKKTKVDRTYLDTTPAFDFIPGGRGFNEALNEKEYDLTSAYGRLGLTVGRWGSTKKAK